STSNYGYGTYRLKVQLPEDTDGIYGIRLDRVTNDSRIFINGKLNDTFGNPSTVQGKTEAGAGPVSSFFHQDTDKLEIMVHVSNYEMPLFGGLTDTVEFGTQDAILHDANESITIQ